MTGGMKALRTLRSKAKQAKRDILADQARRSVGNNLFFIKFVLFFWKNNYYFVFNDRARSRRIIVDHRRRSMYLELVSLANQCAKYVLIIMILLCSIRISMLTIQYYFVWLLSCPGHRFYLCRWCEMGRSTADTIVAVVIVGYAVARQRDQTRIGCGVGACGRRSFATSRFVNLLFLLLLFNVYWFFFFFFLVLNRFKESQISHNNSNCVDMLAMPLPTKTSAGVHCHQI